MAINVFPSETPTGFFYGKASRIPREKIMTEWLRTKALSALPSFVHSGFGLSVGAGTRVANIASGKAIINGFLVESDATLVTSSLAANQPAAEDNFIPHYIWLGLTRAGGDSLVTGATIQTNTSGSSPTSDPDDAVLLGVAGTDASVIQTLLASVKDPRIHGGTYTGNGLGDDDGQILFTGWRPRRFLVTGKTLWNPAGPSGTDGTAQAESGDGTNKILLFNGAVDTNLQHVPDLRAYGVRVAMEEVSGSDHRGLNMDTVAFKYIIEA